MSDNDETHQDAPQTSEKEAYRNLPEFVRSRMGVRVVDRGGPTYTDVYDLASGEKLLRVAAVEYVNDIPNHEYSLKLTMIDGVVEVRGIADVTTQYEHFTLDVACQVEYHIGEESFQQVKERIAEKITTKLFQRTTHGGVL